MKKKVSTKKSKSLKSRTFQKIHKGRLIVLIGGFLLLLIVVIGIFHAFYSQIEYSPYYEIEERGKKIQETVVDGSQAYAWLRVQGTNIDTPIVARNDALEKDNLADYLWTSSEYIEGENRKVIYGHNIRNVSSYPDIANPDHFRFEQLASFARFDFAKNNLYIQYHDGKEEALYKIYAVTFNNLSDEFGQSYQKEALTSYIDEVRKNSVYDYDVDVNDDDTLISLITCTRYFGAYEKTQFKVDARRVRKNEKIVQYKVETNSNYDIIK